MGVRCIGCRREVSEWAARCPHCRRSLDDAEIVPGSDSTEPTPPASTRSRMVNVPFDEVVAGSPPSARAVVPAPVPTGWGKRVSRRRALLAGVAVVAVAAVVLRGLDPGPTRPAVSGPSGSGPSVSGPSGSGPSGSGPSVSGPPITAAPFGRRPPRARLPSGLASERLFFAEPVKTGMYRADGATLTDGHGLAGVGFPAQPLVSGRGVVVYIHGDDAYRTVGPNAAKTVDLGAASWIFPAQHGAIGIETGGQGGPTSIAYMAADGTFPAGPSSKLRLPPGTTAVAQVPSGLIVAAGATLQGLLNEVTHVRLSLIGRHSTVYLGMATSVLGIHGATAAWVDCPSGHSSSCALHLVDTTTRHVRVIRPPPGYSGYAQGGGFSPDGSLLATFVPSTSAAGVTTLRVVVVRVDTGVAAVVGVRLAAGDQAVGDATWTTDGHWLLFGSLGGKLDAEAITPAGPRGAPWKLTLTTSFAVTGD
jgi:hypothetical protein